VRAETEYAAGESSSSWVAERTLCMRKGVRVWGVGGYQGFSISIRYVRATVEYLKSANKGQTKVLYSIIKSQCKKQQLFFENPVSFNLTEVLASFMS